MQPTADPRLDEVIARLDRVERCLNQVQPIAPAAPADEPWPWLYLAPNPRSWRRQPYIKGRNLTVRQLVGTVMANSLTPEAAGADLELPVEVVLEALIYAEQHPELLSFEAAHERLALEQEGRGRGPAVVPG